MFSDPLHLELLQPFLDIQQCPLINCSLPHTEVPKFWCTCLSEVACSMVLAPCHIPRRTICLQITIEENRSNHIDPCNWSYHPPVQPACTLIAIGVVLLEGSFLLLVVFTILLGLWTHWCFLQKKQYIASEPSWKYCWKIGTESFLRIHHVEANLTWSNGTWWDSRHTTSIHVFTMSDSMLKVLYVVRNDDADPVQKKLLRIVLWGFRIPQQGRTR